MNCILVGVLVNLLIIPVVHLTNIVMVPHVCHVIVMLWGPMECVMKMVDVYVNQEWVESNVINVLMGTIPSQTKDVPLVVVTQMEAMILLLVIEILENVIVCQKLKAINAIVVQLVHWDQSKMLRSIVFHVTVMDTQVSVSLNLDGTGLSL